MRSIVRVCWLPAVFLVFVGVSYGRGAPPTGATPTLVGLPTTTADERLLVYIGSSTCDYSNTEGIEEAVAAIAAEVEASAAAEGRRFVKVGIAKDHDVTAGIDHLNKFGRFDEVMSGRNWINVGLLKYVYEGVRGPALTPQIVIVDRRVVNDKSGTRIESEAEIKRLLGLDELRKAAGDQGATAETGR